MRLGRYELKHGFDKRERTFLQIIIKISANKKKTDG